MSSASISGLLSIQTECHSQGCAKVFLKTMARCADGWDRNYSIPIDSASIVNFTDILGPQLIMFGSLQGLPW